MTFKSHYRKSEILANKIVELLKPVSAKILHYEKKTSNNCRRQIWVYANKNRVCVCDAMRPCTRYAYCRYHFIFPCLCFK